MLDFLRRKDKRKPSAHEAVASASAAITSHQSAAAATATARKHPQHVLRDRNLAAAAPSASAAAINPGPSAAAVAASRRLQAQHRPQQIVKQQQQRYKHGDKENVQLKSAPRSIPSTKPKLAKDISDSAISQIHPIEQPPIVAASSHRRWGKRQQVAPASASQPVDGKKKQRKRRQRQQQKHEPTVLKKSVTSDRRRSVKVASPVVVPTGAAAPSVGVFTSAISTKHLAKSAEHAVDPSAARIKSANRVSPEKPHRKPSAMTSAVMKEQQPTWPHTDLALLLRNNDVAAADIPVRRIAAAAVRDDATRLKMIREGVAISIISLLRHEEATLDMRRNATFAIAELAVLEACEDELVAAGSVPVLVWLINPANNNDKSTVGSACRGLRNLLGGKVSTAVQAAKYGCVEPLLSIIDGRGGIGDEADVAGDTASAVVVEAAAAISNLSTHGTRFQSYVIKHGGLNALTTLGMKTENEEAMFHVVNVLAEFAREARWHKAIVAAEGLLTAFRALSLARDPEVAAEASRLVGNVAVTQKARAAVREAGGLVVLIERLGRCKGFKNVVPAFDLVRALANVCVDGRAASDALSQRDGAAVLLNVYTAQDAPERLIKTAFRALLVLAHSSATRRAKVLYAVGIQVKQAGLAGLPVKRLYDLRQAILEDIESGGRDGSAAMPESLERLSRASVRLINSGVVNHGRADPHLRRDAYQNPNHPANLASKSPKFMTSSRERVTDPLSADPTKPDKVESIRRPNVDRNLFRSTGRVVSVTRNCKPKQPGGIKQLAAGRPVAEEEDYEVLPRGNEEALASDSDMRARMLEREADGDMAQDFFEIGQVLGKGGYGSVFMAKDLRTAEIVAIKRFHNSGALVDKKAIKEQNIWKGLHHSNVVEFKGSFVGDNSSLNLVVEYVDGLSLAEHLSQYSAFPETLVAEITRQVLCGLEYLHMNGVTHRDLKPANILVDNSAAVKICDFGVSRSENVQTINPGQQHMVGTPWYIAPEMVEYRPYTTSVDVWSLGCTVLELATGRRPYHELSAMQVLFRMVEDRRPPIPQHLSEEARDFLKACWVWDPQQRPSAGDLLRHPFILKARKFSDSSKQSSSSSDMSTPELGGTC